MSTSYQKFLVLLSKWPVNSQKKTRDYGYFLRGLLKEQKSTGVFFPGAKADFEKQMACLLRLIDNKYRLKYPPTQKLGASGMDREIVGVVLTDDFIEYFNNSQKLSTLIFK